MQINGDLEGILTATQQIPPVTAQLSATAGDYGMASTAGLVEAAAQEAALVLGDSTAEVEDKLIKPVDNLRADFYVSSSE